MLTLHGRRNSSNVQKVLWLCEELGLDVTLVERGGAHGGVDDPAYRALNPNGLVPTLVTQDGFVLWESNAILRYLATVHGDGRLCPADPAARALVEQWMDWQASRLTPAQRPMFMNLVRKPPAERDPAAIAQSERDTAAALAVLDGHLDDRDFIAGADFTVADIACGMWVWRWYQLAESHPAMPGLEAWYERLTERPAYRTHVMQPIT